MLVGFKLIFFNNNNNKRIYIAPQGHSFRGTDTKTQLDTQLDTHKHTHLTTLFPRLPGWAGSRKVKAV